MSDSEHKFDRHADKRRKDSRKEINVKKTRYQSAPTDPQPKCDYCSTPKVIWNCMCSHRYCSQECADKLHSRYNGSF